MHFPCTTLPKVATEAALCVLGYNMTRVINIDGLERMLEAVKGQGRCMTGREYGAEVPLAHAR